MSGQQAGAQPGRQKPRRRYDPDRRANISDAALDVVAEHGVAGTTYRKIAERAGVPLGSLTYHFESLDELLGEAFTKLANHTADGFDEAMAQVGDEEAARAAVVSLITGELLERPPHHGALLRAVRPGHPPPRHAPGDRCLDGPQPGCPGQVL